MRKITKFLLSFLLVVVVIGGGLGTGLYIYLNQEEPVVLDEKPTILMPDEIDVYHKSNFQLKPVLLKLVLLMIHQIIQKLWFQKLQVLLL